MIKELTRFEVADIKTVAQRTAMLRRKRESIMRNIEKLNGELEDIDSNILRWERPILELTEGIYSVDALKLIKDGKLYINEPEENNEAPAPAEENIPGDIVDNNAPAENPSEYDGESVVGAVNSDSNDGCSNGSRSFGE